MKRCRSAPIIVFDGGQKDLDRLLEMQACRPLTWHSKFEFWLKHEAD